MTFQRAVVIGRNQLPHRGHLSLFRAGLEAAERLTIAVGSAHRSRDARNPFTFTERCQMIETMLTPEELSRVDFLPIRDYYDNDRWRDAVLGGVESQTRRGDRIALIGHKKDHTSSYLDIFHGWHLLEAPAVAGINSTDLRNIYFEAENVGVALRVLGNYTSPGVVEYLRAFAHTGTYRAAAAEHRAVKACRAEYTAPFYLTSDAVVETAEHLLLVLREGPIGAGLWALPGGFVEPYEQFWPAVIRELAEETGYRPLPERLRQALRGQAVFDHAERDVRGRIITTAFHFDLQDSHLPQVRGRSDAREARWWPKADLPGLIEQLYADHACIIDRFIPILPAPARSLPLAA